MGIFNKVLPSLAKADDSLAKQIAESVAKREYAHLAELIAVSDKVQAAIAEIERIEPSEAAPAPAKRRAKAKPKGRPKAKRAAAREAKPEAPKQRRRSPSKRGYPKFSKRGDNLVRTDWSNTKKVEQTHAVPYGTVAQIANTIVSDGGAKFRKNILTDLNTPDGKKLPIHQVYLILGWLLSTKAIRKQGRGDYIPDYSKLSADALRGSFGGLSEAARK